jgi:hypothetical protein
MKVLFKLLTEQNSGELSEMKKQNTELRTKNSELAISLAREHEQNINLMRNTYGNEIFTTFMVMILAILLSFWFLSL